MHHRLQFGMRENPASNRRHGSRLAVNTPANSNGARDNGTDTTEFSERNCPASAASNSFPHAANLAATGGGNKNATEGPAIALPHMPSGEAAQGFEPLIGSNEAARLLGNIHVKTLQRYARLGKVPGYRIGGHWYFRVLELDAWLRLQLNSPYQSAR